MCLIGQGKRSADFSSKFAIGPTDETCVLRVCVCVYVCMRVYVLSARVARSETAKGVAGFVGVVVCFWSCAVLLAYILDSDLLFTRELVSAESRCCV